MTQTTKVHIGIPRGFYFQKPNNVMEQKGIIICSFNKIWKCIQQNSVSVLIF